MRESNTSRVAKFDTTTNTWSTLSQGNGNGVSDFSSGGVSTTGAVSVLVLSGNSLFVGGPDLARDLTGLFADRNFPGCFAAGLRPIG